MKTGNESVTKKWEVSSVMFFLQAATNGNLF